jgi:type II secretory pathway pseudopilin PulG
MEKRELRAGKSRDEPPAGEQGYMLLGLIVAIALILLTLSVAATKIAFTLRREREAESVRRADQFVRAIRKFYLKNGHYPASLEQLKSTNNIRYLRQDYVDPLTGKADWRLIAPGQNKTTVKGFFGEPLAGIANAGLGSAAGLQSAGVGGALGSVGGDAGVASAPGMAAGAGAGAAGAGAGATTDPTGAGGSNGTSGGFGSSGGLGSAAGLGSASGSGGAGSGGPIMGVGSSAKGTSILTPNEQTTYDTWEFLYDPRIEKLKAASALNGGPGSVGASTLGGTSIGGAIPGASPATPAGGASGTPTPSTQP